MGDGDRDILALDQRFVLDLDIGVDQFGLARRGEFVAYLLQLVVDDGQHPRPRATGYRDNP